MISVTFSYSVCPIYFHFHGLIHPATGFFSALEVTLVQKVLNIFPRHPFINVFRSFVILFVTVHDSQL